MITRAQFDLIFPEAKEAKEAWAGQEFKKWIVTASAGPEKRPTYHNQFVARARTAQGAEAIIKREVSWLPRRCTLKAHLAHPRELGCVPTPKEKQ